MEPCNEIDLSVEQIPQNPIILEDSSSTDYNTLLNKPSINNVVLIGNKTSEELGLSVEVDDELSLTSENPVQNKVVTGALNGKQDTISDLSDIRSGAALGATAVQPGDLATVATTGAYNDLTGKPGVMTGADGTNPGTSGFVPAPAATDNEKFLRGDGTWAEAGSQGGGTWGSITGTLSDQTDLQTALNAKADNFTIGEGLEWQAGRVLTAPDHIPPHVFTYDNLVAGNDLEINQIIDPNVLNEDTLACFHLDGDTTNAVSTGVTLSDDFKSHITGYTDPLVNPWYPGRSAAIWVSPNTTAWCKLFSEDFDTFGTLEDYTLEFFLAATGANCWFEIKAIENATDGSTYPWITASYGVGGPKYYVRCGADSSTISNSPAFPFGTYSHIAIVRKNQVASIYVNGNLISQAANSLNFKNFAVRMEYETSPAAYLAEMVFSKVAKWDGNFTPPTAPYHQQEGGNQYEIKSTVIEKHATNCLTEVPQHINLELSSGTLTLKAGTKLYIPAGSGIFREVTISNDVTHTNTSGFVGKCLVCYTESGNYILTAGVDTDSSSGANWTATSPNNMRYNTAANLIKWTTDTGSTWSNDTFSFPLGVVTVDGANGITSIDQIFNCLGYIGSTVFVFPGIKGYIPNGYNSDGTLNNTPFETASVLTTNAGYNNHAEVYSITKSAMVVSQYYASQNDKPTTTGTLWYKPVENKMYRVQNDSSVLASNSCLVVRTVRDSSGKITTFNPVGVLRLSENSGASSGLGGNDMPSGQYVDLTLPTTAQTRHHFTAPEDGWFAIDFKRSGSMFFWLGNETKPGIGMYYQQPDGNQVDNIEAYCPVSKGDILGVWFSTNPSIVNYFRFYYTNGSAPAN